MNDIAGRLARESEAAKALLEEFAAAIGDDDELRETTIESGTNWHDAVRRVMARVKQVSGLVKGIKAEQTDIRARRDRFKAQDKRLRKALHKAMTDAGQARPVEFDIGTLSKPKVADVVVYEDEDKIPAGYWKPGPLVLDKDAVKADLEAGKKVPGTRLETNRTTIKISFT